MEASGGGISLEYLQKIGYAKLTYLARAARIRRLRNNLDVVFNVNMGYAGDKARIDKLYDEVEKLTCVEPSDLKADKEKLMMWKHKLKAQKKVAKQKGKK